VFFLLTFIANLLWIKLFNFGGKFVSDLPERDSSTQMISLEMAKQIAREAFELGQLSQQQPWIFSKLKEVSMVGISDYIFKFGLTKMTLKIIYNFQNAYALPFVLGVLNEDKTAQDRHAIKQMKIRTS
jgi:hypothetical protein